MWTSKMSGICAAGTGAFLDSVALKLNIPVEEMADKVNYDSDLEFSSVWRRSGARPPSISSRTAIRSVRLVAGSLSRTGENHYFRRRRTAVPLRRRCGFSGRSRLQPGRCLLSARDYRKQYHHTRISPCHGALGAACLARKYAR